ncbi:MAG TPA: DUF5985 family protein [Polyangiaceae bacterium]
MAEFVYALCAITSLVCTVLLVNGYRRTRAGLLFWSGLCFAGLVVNNVLLFVDLVLVPGMNLGLLRSGAALAAMMVLLYGLVRESR